MKRYKAAPEHTNTVVDIWNILFAIYFAYIVVWMTQGANSTEL